MTDQECATRIINILKANKARAEADLAVTEAENASAIAAGRCLTRDRTQPVITQSGKIRRWSKLITFAETAFKEHIE